MVCGEVWIQEQRHKKKKKKKEKRHLVLKRDWTIKYSNFVKFFILSSQRSWGGGGHIKWVNVCKSTRVNQPLQTVAINENDVYICQSLQGSNNQDFKTRLQDLWLSEPPCYNISLFMFLFKLIVASSWAHQKLGPQKIRQLQVKKETSFTEEVHKK